MMKNLDNAIFLNRNEYYFPHPPEVIRSLTSPYEENFISHYAHPSELDALKTSLASIYNVDKNKLLLGHGAEDIFVKLLCWFRKEVNSIVMEDFSWTNYLHIAEGFDYQVHTIETLVSENSFAFNYVKYLDTLSQLNSAIIFITSPNNPTGHQVNLNKLYDLVALFPQHLFVLDSVYNEFSDKSYSPLFTLKNFILVGSFSKFFGMPGLRLGYAIGSLPKAFQLNLGLQPSTIYAAFAALNNFSYYQSNRNFMLSFSKNLLNKNFKNIKIYQSFAPFFLVKVTNNFIDINNAEEKSGIVPKYILRDDGNYIRFGLGPKEICERIVTYLNSLYI